MQAAQRAHLPHDVLAAELLFVGIGLPDVTHHTAAVAAAMRHERQDGQAVDAMRGSGCLAPEGFEGGDSAHGRVPTITGKRAGSRRARIPPTVRLSFERQSRAGWCSSQLSFSSLPSSASLAGVRKCSLGSAFEAKPYVAGKRAWRSWTIRAPLVGSEYIGESRMTRVPCGCKTRSVSLRVVR